MEPLGLEMLRRGQFKFLYGYFSLHHMCELEPIAYCILVGDFDIDLNATIIQWGPVTRSLMEEAID